jgi:transposase
LRWERFRPHNHAMNQLNVSLQHSILTLVAGGWSGRCIAQELGIHRETVGKYVRLGHSKPAIPPTGSEAELSSKPAILPPGSESVPAPKPAILTLGSGAGRRSQCEGWRGQIEQGIEAGLSAQRIYQDLVREEGFGGGYDAVKRFVRRLTQQADPPFQRIEVEPGAEAQVDFGQGAWVDPGGQAPPAAFVPDCSEPSSAR